MNALEQILASILNPGGRMSAGNRLAQPAVMPQEPNSLPANLQGGQQPPMGAIAPMAFQQGAPQAPAPSGPAPQAPQMPQRGGGGGGGIGGLLQNVLMPQAAGRNQTARWLQSQGMDEGTATLLAGNKQALQQFLLKRAQGADPMDALKLEKTQLEIDQMRNPTTDDIKEYQEARKQGYGGALIDFMKEMKQAGRPETNVTVGGGKFGTIPPGYELVEGPEGAQMRPIPGGPAALEAEEEQRKTEARSEVTQRAAQTVFEDTERALAVLDRSGHLAAGAGSYLAALPTTDARALKKHVDSIKGNVGIDSLLKIKESGAGLGQIPQTQLEMLASLLGNLDTAQSPEDLRFNLARIQEIYADIVEKEGGDPIKMFEERKARIGGRLREGGGLPEGVSEEDLEFTMKKHGLTREEVLERLNAR